MLGNSSKDAFFLETAQYHSGRVFGPQGSEGWGKAANCVEENTDVDGTSIHTVWQMLACPGKKVLEEIKVTQD